MNGGATTSKSTGTNDFTLNSPVSVQSPSASVVTDCADKVRVMRREISCGGGRAGPTWPVKYLINNVLP